MSQGEQELLTVKIRMLLIAEIVISNHATRTVARSSGKEVSLHSLPLHSPSLSHQAVVTLAWAWSTTMWVPTGSSKEVLVVSTRSKALTEAEAPVEVMVSFCSVSTMSLGL